MLNDAGITEGFFSVQIGDRKQDYFYSNGNAGVAVRQFEYDATYDMLAKRGTALFNDYEVGSIFKIGGKEYTSTLIDGQSIKSCDELSGLGVLKLEECLPLSDSYIRLKYKVVS